MRNADRIRSMTVQQLAKRCSEIFECVPGEDQIMCFLYKGDVTEADCYEYWLRWMEEEAK